MADEVTGDRAPRPEGMSDRRLAELKLAVAPGATTYDGIDPNGRCLTCGQQPCECEIGMLRDALCEIERLRADGATLREELVSGRAQWQQERDEYRQIVESRETALATLRERVRKLPTPVNPENDFNRQHVHVWYCRWCGESWLRNATTSDADHPNNGCLWPEVHKLASAPKEPTP